jgi:DNA polymerase III delta prime subunit
MLIETLKTMGSIPFPVSAVNVLVGPSGVGKTQALLDIARLLTGQDPSDSKDAQAGNKLESPAATVVLEDGQFVSPLTEQRLLLGLHVENTDGQEPLVQGLAATLDRAEQCVIRRDTWNVIQRPVLSVSAVAKTELGALLSMRAAYLPAVGRRSLVAPVSAIGPLDPPRSLLQRLQWHAEGVETELNELIERVFSCRIVLDLSQHIEVSLRVLPLDTQIPEFGSMRDKASWLRNFPTLDRFQDGVANVIAIGLTVLMSTGSVVLIDVPELGLHPDACRQLGKWLTKTAPIHSVQLFMATHSAELIEGLQESLDSVTAIRLCRSDETVVARPVPPAVLNGLRTSPYLLSQRGISALFVDAIVVTDNEIERSAYGAAFLDTTDWANRVLFLQTFGLIGLESIMETVTASGIPYVIVSNLELIGMRHRFHHLLELVSGGALPPGLLSSRDKIAACIEEQSTAESLATNTNEVEAFLEEFGKDGHEVKTLSRPDDRAKRWRRLRETGLSGLDTDVRRAMDELCDDLKNVGIFLAPVGSVRNWFDAENKSKWFEQAMSLIQREGSPLPLRAFIEEVLFHLGATVKNE